MRDHTSALEDVLRGSYERRIFATILHGSDPVLEDLEVLQWSLSGDFEDQVKLRGTGTIIYSSAGGESLLPVGTKGKLSPFRARIELTMEIRAGEFSERISLGIFRVTGMPSGRDHTAEVNGSEVVAASVVELRFRSLEEDVRRRGIRVPEQPTSSLSCFDEIRRLTGMPVEESVSDVAIPDGVVWEAKRGSRLEAVSRLGNWLGGTALVNSVGAWTIVPDEVGEPVATLQIGEQGTVVDLLDSIDTDEIYNCIVGTFEDENRNRIDAVAEVLVGDLATDGLYGENTLYWSDSGVKSQSDADAAVAALLDYYAGSLQYDIPVQCHVYPTVELGDVAKLMGGRREIVGRIVKFSMSDSPYMNVTLRVHRQL